MEGNLFKWTNYWKGWQLRWFVLKDGILSYYNTQNDSNNGDCRGSFKIFMFDIIVNKNDNTRMDLILPNEQYLYLKASDYKERQKWLVALASQKASYPSSSYHQNSNESLDSVLKSPSASFLPNTEPNILNMSGTYDSTYFLKIKQSELRLYCDLLTQQTHDFKNLILNINKSTTTSSELKKDCEQNEAVNEHESYKTVSNRLNLTDNLSILSSSFKSFTNMPEDTASSNTQDIDNISSQLIVKSDDTQSIKTDQVKKMDEMNSNINITCDMLIQIIRNLIVLSNTSSNISSDAVKSLLNEAESNQQTSSKADISVDLDQYKYHLYHPLYLNQRLNQYNTKSIPIGLTNKIPIEKSKNSSMNKQHDDQEHLSSQHAEYDAQSLFSSSPSKLSTKSLPFNIKQHWTSTAEHLQTDNNNNNNNINFNNLINKSARKSLYHSRRDLKLPIIHKTVFHSSYLNGNNLVSNISNNVSLSSLKETALLANVGEPVKEINHNFVDLEEEEEHSICNSIKTNNNNNCNFNRNELNENEMIESSTTETVVVTATSRPFKSLTIVAESHHRTTKDHDKNKSFFTVINHRFCDLNLMENDGIPTEFFLNCCSDMFSLLDSFGSTAFLPVKIDVYGNINKIKQKYSANTQKFSTLQAIVQHEIDEKVTHARNSATDALMWLRRAVWFLREFLHEFSKSHDSEMSKCVNISYQNTLKQYHNFVVRSIFSLAMRSLPSKEEFYRRLVADHAIFLENKVVFERQIIDDMKLSVQGIDIAINLIKDFYLRNKLEI